MLGAGAALGVLEQAMHAALACAGTRLLEAVLSGEDGYAGPRAGCGCGGQAACAGSRDNTIITVLGPVRITRLAAVVFAPFGRVVLDGADADDGGAATWTMALRWGRRPRAIGHHLRSVSSCTCSSAPVSPSRRLLASALPVFGYL